LLLPAEEEKKIVPIPATTRRLKERRDKQKKYQPGLLTFPAASNPTIKIRISFFPKKPSHIFVKSMPIFFVD